LQGIYIPVVIGSRYSVFAGSMHDIIVMSYGGTIVEECAGSDEIVDRILKAFTAIHEMGVRHQDISSRNILVDNDGRVTVIDFESAAICDVDNLMVLGEQERVEQACNVVKASGNIDDWRV
jgi:RIO-like serine/threonine protein kinase